MRYSFRLSIYLNENQQIRYLRSEDLTAVKVLMLVFISEDGDNMFLQKVGIYLQGDKVSTQKTNIENKSLIWVVIFVRTVHKVARACIIK